MYTCDMCGKLACKSGEIDQRPINCPCNEEDVMEAVKASYQEGENQELAYHSARVEAEGYCEKTRLEEIMDFADRCGYKKLGLAFCVGLIKEARLLGSILRHNGFVVESVVCKNGSIPKEFLGIADCQKIRPGNHEAMCNPIGQAALLNKAGTQLNIILGLCVGHDSLFMKNSDAPVTVFAVKDRVLAHNPMGALYLSEGYYKKKLYEV